MGGPCVCGCADPRGTSVHPINTALMDGDMDRALRLGLLKAMPCPDCSVDCHTHLVAARADRIRALAARERFRARDARLERRRAERAAQRAPARPAGIGPAATTGVSGAGPCLPPAVAAALERAKARAKAAGGSGAGGVGS